jgi:hypothetical protein
MWGPYVLDYLEHGNMHLRWPHVKTPGGRVFTYVESIPLWTQRGAIVVVVWWLARFQVVDSSAPHDITK